MENHLAVKKCLVETIFWLVSFCVKILICKFLCKHSKFACRMEELERKVETEKRKQFSELQSLYSQFKAYQNCKAQEIASLEQSFTENRTENRQSEKQKRSWIPAGVANRRKLSHSPQKMASISRSHILTEKYNIAPNLLQCAHMGKFS